MGGVDVLVELSGGECGPFRCYHDEVRLALLIGFSDELKEVIWVGLELGYQYRLRTTRNGAHEGQVAAVPTHHLDYMRPVVGTGSISYAVYGLKRRVQRRVDTYGNLGAPHVVVYGGRDHHQRIDLGFLEFADCAFLPFWGLEFLGALGAQQSAAPLDDAP